LNIKTPSQTSDVSCNVFPQTTEDSLFGQMQELNSYAQWWWKHVWNKCNLSDCFIM